MNFDTIKALLRNEEETIRMEQSLYVAKSRPLDIFTIPFDDFSDVCRIVEETENAYNGMSATILNKKNNFSPQYTIRLTGGVGIENWRLIEAGVFENENDIKNTFSTQVVGDKMYRLYKLVPLSFEFKTREKVIENVYKRYQCVGYDTIGEKLILKEISPVIMKGIDLIN